MPNPGSYTTDDALPLATLRARDRDRSWMDNGACRNPSTGVTKRAWTITEAEVVEFPDGSHIRGKQLVEAALVVCSGCPVQWDCAIWAIEVDESVGTWGARMVDLEWLKRRPRAVQRIEAARKRGVSVQKMIARARGRRA